VDNPDCILHCEQTNILSASESFDRRTHRRGIRRQNAEMKTLLVLLRLCQTSCEPAGSFCFDCQQSLPVIELSNQVRMHDSISQFKCESLERTQLVLAKKSVVSIRVQLSHTVILNFVLFEEPMGTSDNLQFVHS